MFDVRMDTVRTLGREGSARPRATDSCEDMMTVDSETTPTTTPPRSVRIPDELWQAGRWVGTARRETLSDVINVAVAQYVLDGMQDTSGKLTDTDKKKLHDLISEDEVKRIIRRRTP